MSARYLPGDHAVLVSDHAVVAAEARVLDRILLFAEDRPLGSLDVISTLSGGVLTALPEFAAVVVDGDDLVALVRGAATVEAGGETVSSHGVSTWIEHRLSGAAGQQVAVKLGDPGSGPDLPLAGGVVLASAVTWAGSPSKAPAADVAQPRVDEPRVDKPVVRQRATISPPSGEVIEFESAAVIGRVPVDDNGETAVVVDNPHVSSTHLRVELADGCLWVTDQSTNGTMVSGPGQQRTLLEKGVPTVISDGSELWLAEDVNVVVALQPA